MDSNDLLMVTAAIVQYLVLVHVDDVYGADDDVHGGVNDGMLVLVVASAYVSKYHQVN